MHLVHKPTLRTPDTEPGTKNIDKLYDDNIRYMDKQLGELVEELEKLGLRENTLIIFSGDNGTAAGYPSPVHGRMINGWKGSMLEGGSRSPLHRKLARRHAGGQSAPDDIVSFADIWPTFAEIAGVKPPEGFKTDGQSFAPQLRGEPGTPRAWAYVQLGAHWYVREPGFKLNEAGELFDMSDAPFVEKLIEPAADTEQSKAARAAPHRRAGRTQPRRRQNRWRRASEEGQEEKEQAGGRRRWRPGAGQGVSDPGVAELSAASQSRARPNRSSRSRALRVSDAARSNSSRASASRPSFSSRSPRTAGKRW